MMRYRCIPSALFAAISLLFLGLWGCDSGGANPAVDGDEEDTTDQEGTAEEEESGKACLMFEDCDEGQDCRDGKCVNAAKCYDGNDECARDEICNKKFKDEYGWCRVYCTTDMNCPATGQCMNGVCEPYEGLPAASPLKTGADAVQSLKGGVAIEPLDFPFGVSLGGYGLRKGTYSGYQAKMGGCTGNYDRPYVKAMVIDNGKDQIILVRHTAIFGTDFLLNEVVRQVIAATGKDITRNLVVTSTHSHSMPGRFWNILPGMGFGVLGLDEFSYEIWQRIASSIARAILAAQADLKPVAIGYAINPDFDPQHIFHRDRRGENNPVDGGSYADPRMFMLRMDDMTDSENPKPMAVIINFAAHGTMDDQVDTFATQDTAGGVESMFQKFFEADEGVRIEAMFMQGMAGDVSPGGDQLDHEHQQKMQLLGTTLYPIARALYDSIEMSSNVDMEIVTRRIPVDHEIVGYTDEEYISYDVVAMGCQKLGYSEDQCDRAEPKEMAALACADLGIPESNCQTMCLMEPAPYGSLRFGAFQCGLTASFEGDEDGNTKLSDGCLGCMLKMEGLNFGPLPQFSKTRLSALHIDLHKSGVKPLVMSILPGEPMSRMGTEFVGVITAEAKAASGVDHDGVILGYTNDHYFYLLLDEDYLQAGYETSMSVWGPKFGGFLLEEGRKLTNQLFTTEVEDNSSNVKPLLFRDKTLDKVYRVPTVTPEAKVGAIVEDVPATYERMTKIRFHYTGGDNGVDRPHIVLQKKEEAGDQFADVTNTAGRLYDEALYNILVEWENPAQNNPRCDDCEDLNHWYISFEDTRYLATGTYRFHVSGFTYKGSTTVYEPANVESYEFYTGQFQVVPTTRMFAHDLAVDFTNGVITGGLAYPTGPTTDDGVSPFDKLEQKGLALQSDKVRPVIGPPVEPADITAAGVVITFTPAGGGAPVAVDTPTLTEGQSVRTVVSKRYLDTSSNLVEETTNFGGRMFPALLFSAPVPAGLQAGTYTLTVSIADAMGNTGVTTKEVVVP